MSQANTSETSDSPQAGLAEFNYEEHKKETPDNVEIDVTEGEDIYTLNKGDVVWISGEEYVVAASGIALISPASKYVIGEDGTHHQLIAGKVPREDAKGVTWRDNIRNKDKSEMGRQDIVEGYDDVYVTHLGEDSLERLFNRMPESTSRKCPNCDHDTTGEIEYSEPRNNSVIEVRRCLNTDTHCDTVFQYEHEIDQNNEAKLLLRDTDEGVFRTQTITGFFDAEEQDDFKFPLDTHDWRHDGWRTAEEIATMINPKMVTDGINEMLQSGDYTPEDLVNMLSFERSVTSGVRNAPDKMETQDYSTILTQKFGTFHSIKSIASELPGNSTTKFIDTLYAIETGISGEANKYTDAHIEPASPEMSTTDIAQLITDLIANPEGSRLQTRYNQTKAGWKIINAFNREKTGEDFLTSTIFYDLLTNVSSINVIGEFTKRTSKFDDREKEGFVWRDSTSRLKSNMQIKYTPYRPNQQDPFEIGYMWGQPGYDATYHFTPNDQNQFRPFSISRKWGFEGRGYLRPFDLTDHITP